MDGLVGHPVQWGYSCYSTQHDTVWKQRGPAAASGLNSVVWLMISQEPWPLILCSNRWVILKGLTLQLRQCEAIGGWSWVSFCGVRTCGKTFESTCKSLSLLTFPHPNTWGTDTHWQSGKWGSNSWPFSGCSRWVHRSGHHSVWVGWEYCSRNSDLLMQWQY